jgi:hypothetical protein
MGGPGTTIIHDAAQSIAFLAIIITLLVTAPAPLIYITWPFAVFVTLMIYVNCC